VFKCEGGMALERRQRRLDQDKDLGRGVERKLVNLRGERPESCDAPGASCRHCR
jgi:hypothetical protein